MFLKCAAQFFLSFLKVRSTFTYERRYCLERITAVGRKKFWGVMHIRTHYHIDT